MIGGGFVEPVTAVLVGAGRRRRGERANWPGVRPGIGSGRGDRRRQSAGGGGLSPSRSVRPGRDRSADGRVAELRRAGGHLARQGEIPGDPDRPLHRLRDAGDRRSGEAAGRHRLLEQGDAHPEHHVQAPRRRHSGGAARSRVERRGGGGRKPMSSLARRSFASRCGALSLFLVSIAATPGAWSAATGTWTPAGSMTTDRDGHTVTTLPSGLVLVAGGSGSLGYLASAEVYNPGSGIWSLVNSMATSRRDHTATRLADGRVLVAGGINSGASTGMKSAELFDPGTGLWSSAGSMLTGRWLHTATLLGNGKVLVAGGFQSFAVGELSSAELYEPAS